MRTSSHPDAKSSEAPQRQWLLLDEVIARGAAASGKRLAPIFRMVPRRRELNLINFNCHYHSALSKADPSLKQWLTQGLSDAAQPTMKLFWDATFQADP